MGLLRHLDPRNDQHSFRPTILLGFVQHPSKGAPMPDSSVIHASSISLNEALLRVAAVHQHPVTFRYAKGDGKVIETRTLVPSDVASKDDHVTFTGYDPDRDSVRAYRTDRIKGQVTVE